jgi:ribosomal protein L11 methyltransferase
LQSILFTAGLEPEELDLLVAELWERGTAGILQEDGLRAFFTDSRIAQSVAADYRQWVAQIREEGDIAASAAPEECDPILIGSKFFVVPSSSTIPTPQGRMRLALDAITAFGTGRHESTQLVMEVLEAHPPEAAEVLDVGCGSGILSLAALSLGASLVVSCDVHPDAIATAARYLHGKPLFRGTVDAVRDSAVDVVIANISAAVVDMIAADLSRIVRPGGILLLAGFLQGKVPTRFTPEREFEKNGWLCWICRSGKVASAAEEQQGRIARFTENWW